METNEAHLNQARESKGVIIQEMIIITLSPQVKQSNSAFLSEKINLLSKIIRRTTKTSSERSLTTLKRT